jgi:hypothetical protein
MMLAGRDAVAGRVSGRCAGRPPDRSQYVGGVGGVNSGVDDQRPVDLATGARKQRAGLGRAGSWPPGRRR